MAKSSGGTRGTSWRNNKGTEDRNEVLDGYISGNMMWVNNYLRGIGDFGNLTPTEKEYINRLKEITESNTVNDTILYRSVDAKAIFNDISSMGYDSLVDHVIYGDTEKNTMNRAKHFIDSVVGKEFTEKGFMSTTRSHDIAAEWGDYTGANHPIMMKIHTTSNTKGVDIEKYSLKHHTSMEMDSPQREVLLRSNQRFKVIGISKDSGNICVEVQLIDKK